MQAVNKVIIVASKKRTAQKSAAKKPASRVRTGKVSGNYFGFSPRGILSFAGLFAVAGATLIITGFAASPNSNTGKKATGSSPLSLAPQQITNNPNSPDWCDNEDDVHDYQGTGSLSGSLTSTQQFCGLSSDYYNGLYWDAGGEGTALNAFSSMPLTDMTITAPSGDVHHTVLVGTSTSKGATTYHYQTCYVPNYSRSTDTGGYPLPGGTWTYAITGNAPSVTYTVRVVMTDASFQQANCPASEQNLSS